MKELEDVSNILVIGQFENTPKRRNETSPDLVIDIRLAVGILLYCYRGGTKKQRHSNKRIFLYNTNNLKMIAYRKEKIDNAICFFATEHQKKSGKPLTQTYLYKYLAFLDFLSVEKMGIPALDLEYRAMPWGPVPHKLYNERKSLKTDLYEFIDMGNEIFVIRPKAHADLIYFSEFERDIMNQLISRYATHYGRANEISEDSHKKIRAYDKTYKIRKNGIINYILTFNSNPYLKPRENRTQAEDAYVIYDSLKQARKCTREK